MRWRRRKSTLRCRPQRGFRFQLFDGWSGLPNACRIREMVRAVNRSFEDRDTSREFTSQLALVYRKDHLEIMDTPEGWRSDADSNGVMLIDLSQPLNAQNPTSLCLEVTKRTELPFLNTTAACSQASRDYKILTQKTLRTFSTNG